MSEQTGAERYWGNQHGRAADLVERFWGKTYKDGDCLIWQGHLMRGYGRFWNGRTMVSAHRFAYTLRHGVAPKELHHTCGNRACVNPDHLRRVTREEHVAYHRPLRTECGRGHALTGRNLYVRNDGERECRACATLKQRERRERKRKRWVWA